MANGVLTAAIKAALSRLGMASNSDWYPKAIRFPYRDVDYEEMDLSAPPRGVIHTTDTTYWPKYSDGKSAPHFTVRPDFSSHTVEVRQHIPMAYMARMITSSVASTTRANRLHCYQIACVGTSIPSRSDSRWFVGNWPDWYYDGIADLMRWIEETREVPRRSTVPFIVDFTEQTKIDTVRMTGDQWRVYSGWCGHQHVANTAAGDPGDIDIDYLLDPYRRADPWRPKIPLSLGRLPLKVDGRFGRQTASALQRISGGMVSGGWGIESARALQRYLGVPATGEMNDLTISALKLAARIDCEDAVWDAYLTTAIQETINAKTFTARGLQVSAESTRHMIRVDGSFGPQTVKALQRVLGVTVDGAFGRNTREALQRYLDVPRIDGRVLDDTVRQLQIALNQTPTGVWTSDTTRDLQFALNMNHLHARI